MVQLTTRIKVTYNSIIILQQKLPTTTLIGQPHPGDWYSLSHIKLSQQPEEKLIVGVASTKNLVRNVYMQLLK